MPDTINHSKLITLFKTFTSEEFITFGRSLESIGSEGQNILVLYSALQAWAPAFSRKIFRPFLFEKMYSEEGLKSCKFSQLDAKELDRLCGLLFDKALFFVSRYAVNNYPWYKTLSLLDKRQLKQFQKFVNSPYFNRNNEVSKIYHQIHKNIKKAPQSEYQNWIYKNGLIEKLWGKKFKKFEIQPAFLRKINQKLNSIGNLVNRFLIVEYAENDVYTKHFCLGKSFENMELYGKPHLGKVNQMLKNTLTNHTSLGMGHMEILELSSYFDARFSMYNHSVQNQHDSVQYHLDCLNDYHMFKYLRFCTAPLIRGKHTGKFFSFAYYSIIEEYFKKTNKKNHPTLELQFQVVQLFRNGSERKFKDCLNFLAKNKSEISRPDLVYFYKKLITYINFETLSGPNKTYATERVGIYKKLIQTGVDFNYFVCAFTKIVKCCTEEGDLVFPMKLIEEHQDRLLEGKENFHIHMAKSYVWYGLFENSKEKQSYYFLYAAAKELGLLRAAARGNNINIIEGFSKGLYFRILRIKVKYDLLFLEEKFLGDSTLESTLRPKNEIQMYGDLGFKGVGIPKEYVESGQYLKDLSSPRRSGTSEDLYTELVKDIDAFEKFLSHSTFKENINSCILSSFQNFKNLLSSLIAQTIKIEPSEVIVQGKIDSIIQQDKPLIYSKWLLGRFNKLL